MTQVSEIIVRWTPEESGRVSTIQIQSRIVGTPEWTEQAAAHDALAGEFRFMANAPSTDVEVRVRYRMIDGMFGAWTTDHIVTSPEVIEYDTLTGLPISLGDINPGEGSKLDGIDFGATVGAPIGTPVGDRPAEEVIDQLDGNTVAVKQLPDLVTSIIQEPLDRLSALHLSFGVINLRKSIALADGNAVAIRDLKTYVDEHGAVVSEDLLNLTSRVGQNEAGLLVLNETYADDKQATASQLTDLIARTGANEAQVIEEIRVRTDQQSSTATGLEQLGAKTGANEAAIEEAKTATADLESATATRFNGLETRVGDSETKISTLQNAVNHGNDAMAQQVTELGVKIDDETTAREGAIRTEELARINADGVLSGRVDQISAAIDAPATGIRSVIENVQETVASNDQTRATQITQLESRLNNVNGSVGASLEQRMQTLMDANGKLETAWTLKVQQDVNGQAFVSGGGLVMQNGVSAISWLADSFRIMVPGQSPRQVFYSDSNGVFIANASIANAAIDTLKVAGGAITANQVVTSGDTYVAAGGEAYFLETGYMIIGDGNYGSGIIDVSFTVDATSGYDSSCLLEMWIDNGSGWTLANSIIHGISTDDGDTVSRVYGALKTVVSGSQVRVRCRCTSGTYTARSVARIIYMRNIAMTLIGAKR